jgi:hypothetical protein
LHCRGQQQNRRGKSVILSASVAAQARGEFSDRFIVSANRKIAGHEVEAQTRGYFGESPRLGSPVLRGPCSALPASHRQKALGAVERSYRKIAMD